MTDNNKENKENKEHNESKQDRKAKKKIRFRTMAVESESRYRTLLTDKFKNRKQWIAPDESKIIAVMPGTIVTVLVRKGQVVEKGDSLLILESMKMQNNIISPRHGKIKAIKVAAGQNIPKDYVMIEFED